MAGAEFDEFAEQYSQLLAASVAITGEPPEFFAEYKVRDIARAVGRSLERGEEGPLDPTPPTVPPLRICDFGAGIGGLVPHFRRYFPGAELTCVDVSQRSLAIAEQRFPGLASYVPFEGSQLPFPADRFDISCAACVFHHIDPAAHAALFSELLRTLRPGGRLFVFEHNPWNPLTVRAVHSCPFDANATLIAAGSMKRRLAEAGFAETRVHYRLFFPHALRILRPLERALTWLPLGGQYLAMTRK